MCLEHGPFHAQNDDNNQIVYHKRMKLLSMQHVYQSLNSVALVNLKKKWVVSNKNVEN